MCDSYLHTISCKINNRVIDLVSDVLTLKLENGRDWCIGEGDVFV